jgi:hypothetical protein
MSEGGMAGGPENKDKLTSYIFVFETMVKNKLTTSWLKQ